jgi:hypothetical protein
LLARHPRPRFDFAEEIGDRAVERFGFFEIDRMTGVRER